MKGKEAGLRLQDENRPHFRENSTLLDDTRPCSVNRAVPGHNFRGRTDRGREDLRGQGYRGWRAGPGMSVFPEYQLSACHGTTARGSEYITGSISEGWDTVTRLKGFAGTRENLPD